ncbi:MAG TPA: terminase family protein [Caulobacterales bacterium]|nr:terminase family protein [Caulobacterales bacterium]
MTKLCAPKSEAELLASLTPTAEALLLKFWKGSRGRLLRDDWRFWARREQLPPEGDWRTWLFIGGRGAGKTRAGAEWVSERARRGRSRSIALIGPTFHDVREVMVEGNSGLRALTSERPHYEASRRRLVWRNGVRAYCYSAEDPESLRGPQFDAAWADELCFWPYPDETLKTLSHGLRLGERPLLMATTTPRPIAALKRLIGAPDTVTTRGATWNNAANLPGAFIEALNERWTGAAYDRQELLGDLVEDLEGALWKHGDLEAVRGGAPIELERIVVAVDPPSSIGAEADACGIVAAGAGGEGFRRCAVVLADASARGLAPHAWAARVAELARSVGAHAIIAEANNGGEMVRVLLRLAAPEFVVRLVHASAGKRARAEPVAMLYAQGRVRHAAAFPALEDEMCAFGAPGFRGSPDRLDALVWALTDLMLNEARPSLRAM